MSTALIVAAGINWGLGGAIATIAGAYVGEVNNPDTKRWYARLCLYSLVCGAIWPVLHGFSTVVRAADIKLPAFKQRTQSCLPRAEVHRHD